MAGWLNLAKSAYSLYEDFESNDDEEKAFKSLTRSTAPPVDSADLLRQQEQDRRRRRRGTFGNIYAGANASKPTVRAPVLSPGYETLG